MSATHIRFAHILRSALFTAAVSLLWATTAVAEKKPAQPAAHSDQSKQHQGASDKNQTDKNRPNAKHVDPQRVAVELTYLLAKPGDRDRMIEYIQRNWFAMDAIAVSKGLMANYRVLDTGTDEGPWNVLVEVTYRDSSGYHGVQDAFEQIRTEHKEVLIDQRGLRDLGRVVESKLLFTAGSDSSALMSR
jgi:hypothetical protein